jgi:SAM-dependent methyltransferase
MPDRAPQADARYREFWEEVGDEFPDLGPAASTRFYRNNEIRLLTEHLPALSGLRVLKTDLWDEARNTRILHWAAEQGAETHGVDISGPTARRARANGPPGRLKAVLADTARLPYGESSFDAVYSMGTIEHFRHPEVAVGEMFRVLKPGGRAIVGVPNLWDPFLRPLLVEVLDWLKLYSYGYERAFSRRALSRMLENAGFEIAAETGILFIPGWLRMLDLACHSWCRPLARLTAMAVWPFAFLDRHIAFLRRHGYLIASVGVKSGARGSSAGG